jgi:hypothetical protein
MGNLSIGTPHTSCTECTILGFLVSLATADIVAATATMSVSTSMVPPPEATLGR